MVGATLAVATRRNINIPAIEAKLPLHSNPSFIKIPPIEIALPDVAQHYGGNRSLWFCINLGPKFFLQGTKIKTMFSTVLTVSKSSQKQFFHQISQPSTENTWLEDVAVLPLTIVPLPPLPPPNSTLWLPDYSFTLEREVLGLENSDGYPSRSKMCPK